MCILVTGGAGYIGSHTAVALLESGYRIAVIDNLSNAKLSAIEAVRSITGKDFPFYQADILDESALDRVFSENRIQAAIHFAALKAVGESTRHPLEYYHNNVGGTVSLCRAMTAHRCFRLVYSSSATVYGDENPVPYREDQPRKATNPYGQTKIVCENLLEDLCRSDERWRCVNLRYFNPIGAHPSGLIGDDPAGIPNNLLPYVARVAAGKLDMLSVFGGDYDTPDGTGIRDYLHVCDLAEGHVKALELSAKSSGCTAVNLGSGHGYSVLEIIRAFERASGQKGPYRIADRRPGDVAISYADTGKANELLGWSARRCLDDMCRDMWRFASSTR
jgi:UDP-glucose 4-epimerase